MSSQFVTEFIAEEPLVLVVGESSKLSRGVVRVVEAQGLQAMLFSPESLGNPQNKKLLSSAYKTIWVNESRGKTDDSFQNALTVLAATKTPVTVIFPIITSIKAPQNQSDFGYSWAAESQEKQEMILSINEKFPGAQFIFARDLIAEADLELSPLKYSLERLKESLVIDPEIVIHPLGYEQFFDQLGELLVRPQSPGSFLLEAPGQSSTNLLNQLVFKLEQYHDVEILVESKPQVSGKPLPFSASSRQIEGISGEELQKIARSLPKPQVVVRAKSAVPSASKEDRLRAPEKLEIPEEPKKTAPLQLPQESKKLDNPGEATVIQPDLEPTQQDKPSAIIPDNPLDVNEELQRIFATARSGQRVTRVKSKAKTQKRQKRKTKRRTALFWGGVVSVVLASIILVLSGVFFSSQYLMRRSLMSVVAQAAAEQNLQLIEQEGWKKTETIAGALNFQTNLYSSIFNTSMFSQASLMIESVEQIKAMVSSVSSTHEAASELVLQVLTGKGGDTRATAQKLLVEADKSYSSLSLFQAGLDQLELSGDDQVALEMLKQYEKKVRELRQGLAVVQQLDQHLPALTGVEAKKTYALLLQNNHELRPTGGFISAVALLNFERGTLVSYQVYSSYELDKRFSGVVAPPGDIVNYLGEENWYLRDSNWDPHFPASAEQISWFIEKSSGVKVDGVLGINLLTVEDLIQALGPIDLPEYNETLTDKNLQERMEFHSEVILVPQDGSRDYSALVLEKLVEKMRSISPDKTSAFLSALAENLNSQQLTVAIFDEKIADTMNTLGWTGGLINPDCPSQLGTDECQVDSIAQIEANVGVNKANYYLKRSVNHNITINTGAAEHQRIITLENTAQSNAWPKGTYRNFIRFYLPPNADFSTLSVNGSALPGDQVIEREENGKKVVGALIEVPVGAKSQLILEYQVPLQMEAPFSYAFFNQNQSGTTQTPVAVKITSPASLQPVLVAPQAEILDNTIIFDNINETHSFVGVNFQ